MHPRSRQKDANGLKRLVARLKRGGFTLLDCQFQTAHLAGLGAVEIDRTDYLAALSAALAGTVGLSTGADALPGDWTALDRAGADSFSVSGPVAGKDIVQLLVHTS